jgi:transposase InsO family protein
MGVYSRRTAANTIHFLKERVLEEMPFPIQCLQTDHGREFTAYKVQDTLAEYSIRFRPIRPRSPHLNGKVKRAQRTVLDEFYAKLDLAQYSLEQLNDELAYWQHYYNWERMHGGIGQCPNDKRHDLSGQTPFWDEVIDRYDPAAEAKYAARWQVDPYRNRLKRSL